MTRLSHTSLSTDFDCAGRVVTVSIVGLHSDTNRPIWDIAWSSRPARLSSRDIVAFDASAMAAKATLKARLAKLNLPALRASGETT
jgi:hypothetical protein